MLYFRRTRIAAALVTLAGIGLALAGHRGSQAGPSVLPSPRAEEVRGLWVVRTDMTTPQAVSRVVRHAQANGLNSLFVQVRGRADAYYRSELEPRAQALEKAPADFDPLAQIIREGGAAGLKVHAWVNACYVWSEAKAPKSPAHMLRTHPEWLAVGRAGRRCTVGDKEVFVCPGNPEARAHLTAVCRDLADRYELDGLQLDYIRYADANLCYCSGCLRRFEEELTPKIGAAKLAAARKKGRLGLVTAYSWSWRQFRRDQVTTLVRSIRQAVKQERPSIVLSAAVIPWGSFPGDFTRSDAYNTVGQDWYGWIRTGLVDAVCPMTYQAGLPGFKSWVDGVTRDHPNFPVWFGIGSYLFGPESTAAKVQAVRGKGGSGWVLFSYSAVTRGGKDDAYLRTLKARVLPSTTAAAR